MAFLKKVWEKIKKFFMRFKEENAGFLTAMKRMNSPDFCGNVNRGIKNGDFWEGSYVNVTASSGVIYGSNQVDYVFTGNDIASVENLGTACNISVGNQQLPGVRLLVTFKDGKRAQMDIVSNRLAKFNMGLGL